jgi:hypothetical protein
VEELGPQADPAVAVIVLTVLLSVVAHGLTAGPLAARYGARSQPDPAAAGDPAPATRFAMARPDRRAGNATAEIRRPS